MSDNDLWKKVSAGVLGAMAVASFSGLVGHSMGENKVDSKMVEDLSLKDNNINALNFEVDRLQLKVSALENLPPVEVEVIKEVPVMLGDEEVTLESLEQLKEDLADAETTRDAALDNLNKYDDEISELMLEDSAFAEVGVLFDSEDRSEDYDDLYEDLVETLVDEVRDEWNLEDLEDDLIYVKLLDNSEMEVDVSDEDDGVKGTILAEVKIKFRTDGEDGDRHSEKVMVKFELEEGEVTSYSIEE